MPGIKYFFLKLNKNAPYAVHFLFMKGVKSE